MDILARHLSNYPEEQLSDVVKLLFQRSFGAGHMIKDENDSLIRLRSELDAVEPDGNKALTEDIGGDFVRVNLAAAKGRLSAETLNRIFVLSATADVNAAGNFEKSLGLIRNCRMFPFTEEEKEEYLEKYRQAGYPPVSHSEIYRRSYDPHYRIVRKKYAGIIGLLSDIDSVLREKGSVHVGIDGMAASGKTTLAETLSEIYDCSVFHADDYFLQPHQRTEKRLSEPGGNIDCERMKAEITDRLDGTGPFFVRRYDCSSMKLLDETRVERKPVIIVEGVYSLHPYFGDVYDIKRVLSVSREEQMRRLRERDPELVQRFIEEWLPMEDRYFSLLHV